jgi:hypothetical protein
MIEFLRGEFANSREPSDLTEEKGRYCRYVREIQSSGGAEPLIEATRVVGSIRISYVRVSWVGTL